jgi:hypothetical protein
VFTNKILTLIIEVMQNSSYQLGCTREMRENRAIQYFAAFKIKFHFLAHILHIKNFVCSNSRKNNIYLEIPVLQKGQ